MLLQWQFPALGFASFRYGVLHDLKECKRPQLSVSRAHFTGLKLSNEYYHFNDSKRRSGQGHGSKKHEGLPQNMDLPPILPKKKKKPYLIPLKKILQASRADKKLAEVGIEKPLEPPKNGLLVPDVVPVAYDVLDAWKILIGRIERLLHIVPVYACSECLEVHVVQSGHEIQDCQGTTSGTQKSFHSWVKGSINDVLLPIESYHMYDPFGRRIKLRLDLTMIKFQQLWNSASMLVLNYLNILPVGGLNLAE